MKRTHVLLFGCFWLSALVSTAFAQTNNQLALSDLSSGPGKTIVLPVTLANTDSVVALQCLIGLPQGMQLHPDRVTLTERKADHILSVYAKANNTYLLLVYSPTNKPLNGKTGNLINLSLRVPDTWAYESDHPMTLSEVVLSNPRGGNVATAPRNGNLRVIEVPTPDLQPLEISTPAVSLQPGDSIRLNWTVANNGTEQTANGWSEQLSLVGAGGQHCLLGTLYYPNILAAGSSVAREGHFSIPNSTGLSGNVQLQVKVIPYSDTGELSVKQANNTLLSVGTYPLQSQLQLSLPTTPLPENSSRRYACQLYRSGSYAQAQTFTLTAAPTERINYPATVTIPAGQSGVQFYVTPVNNATLDPTGRVQISASGNGYKTRTETLLVEDDEYPTLSLTATKAVVTEGDSLELTVTATTATTEARTIYLSCNLPKRFSYPSTLVLPAGRVSCSTKVAVVNDQIADVAKEITFTATAAKQNKGECYLLLNDDDMPTMEMSIAPSTVNEMAVYNAMKVTLTRTSHLENTVTVNLSDNSNAELYYAYKSFTFKPGEVSKQFTLGVNDNNFVEGDRSVEVTAAVYIASCSCSASGSQSQGVVKQAITLLDNDGPSLQLSTSQTTLLEGKAQATILTVTRNTSTQNSLEVTLSSDADDDLDYTPTVVIPAGKQSVQVPVSVRSNGVAEGDRTITLSATATGYTKGICWAQITDQTLPDFQLSQLTLSESSCIVEDSLSVTLQLENHGAIGAASGLPLTLYLARTKQTASKQALELTTLLTHAELPVDGCLSLTARVAIPALYTGDYFIFAQVNAEEKVKELSFLNNGSPYAPLTIQPPFSVTTLLDRSYYLMLDTVRITGQASGRNYKQVPIDLYYLSNDIRKVAKLTTDDTGAFRYDLPLESWQMGTLAVGACYPDANSSEAQSRANIFGLKKSQSGYKDVTWDIQVGDTKRGTIRIKNLCSVPQTGLQVTTGPLPEGCTLHLETPLTIPALGEVDLSYVVSGTIASGDDYSPIALHVCSQEGAVLPLTAYYYAASLKPQLKASVTSINTTMSKGQVRDYSIDLINQGLGETGEMMLYLPTTDWLSAATPLKMPSLAPGDTTTLVIRFTPGTQREAHTYEKGNLSIGQANGDPLSIGFYVETVSESTGNLRVVVCDELTYNTVEAPHLAKANVSLRHPYTNQMVYEGVTDSTGILTIADIPEGYYTLKVTASRHEGYSNTVLVNPGRTTQKTVDLFSSLVVIDWDVVETTVEDHYSIVTNAVYETRVPRPVVKVEFPKELPFEDQLFHVTATNEGFITATDVRMDWQMPDGVEIELLNEVDSFTLPAKSSCVFYCKMKVNPGAAGAPQRQGPRRSVAGCLAGVLGMYYSWYCGVEDSPIGQEMANYSSGECGDMFSGLSFLSKFASIGSVPTKGGGKGTTKNNHGTGSYGGGPAMARDCSDCKPEICGASDDPFNTATNLGKDFLTGVAGIPTPNTCLMSIADPCNRSGMMSAPSRKESLQKASSRKAATLAEGFVADDRLPSFAQAIQETAYYGMGYYNASMAYFKEMMADTLWYDQKIDAFNAFWEQVQEIKPLENEVTVERLLPLAPAGITEAQVVAFVERLNNTRRSNLGEIILSSNVINMDNLNAQQALVEEAFAHAKSKGYEHPYLQFAAEYEGYKEEAEKSSANVCATITLQFEQDFYFSRQAFEGTLTLTNSLPLPLNEVDLYIEVTDEEGILATSHEFEIHRKSKKGFAGELEDLWTLEPESTGTAIVEFIPTRYAAETANKPYRFGGKVSYIDPYSGLRVSYDLNPVTLTVKPSPLLELHYFLQRDVIGDDPLTEAIEPMEEGEFSLLINNIGNGIASDARMVTKQPQIIENEKGLLVDFAITSSSLNGKEKTLALGEQVTTSFGSIPPHTSTYAQWFLTGSLLGHFISYDVSYTHITSFDNPDLTLLDTVQVHELIHSIEVPGTTLKGFLANDFTDAQEEPDMLYLTDGSVEEVHAAYELSTTHVNDSTYLLTVTPSINGWNFGTLDDPTDGRCRLIGITRNSDGMVISGRNIWQTFVTLRDGLDPLYENKLSVADCFGSSAQSYTLHFEPRPLVELAVNGFDGLPEGTSESPVTELLVHFNKAIDRASFTTDDLKLIRQGDVVDLSAVQIDSISEATYRIDLSALAPADGYHFLTVQTATILDAEGYNGKVGEATSWNQLVGGKINLTVKILPEGAGQVTPMAGSYPFSEFVTFEEKPNPGYQFRSWVVNAMPMGSDSLYQHIAIANRTIEARFIANQLEVTVKADRNQGKVTGLTSNLQDYGSTLRLVAVPEKDYRFVGWVQDSVQLEGNSRILSFTVQKATCIEALFAPIYSTCSLALEQGWNWISHPFQSVVESVPSLTGLHRSLLEAWGQNEELVNDQLAGLTGNLREFYPSQMYKIHLSIPARLSLTGVTATASLPIPLSKGWTWMGYPLTTTQPLQTALQHFHSSPNDILKSQEGFAVFNGTEWVGNLTELNPGLGYQYFATQASTGNFLYEVPAVQPAPSRWASRFHPATWELDRHKYPDVMGLIAELKDVAPDEYVVAAFEGEECRGIGEWVDELIFMPLYGTQENETLHFKAINLSNGICYDLKETVTRSGNLIGSLTAPFRLTLPATGTVVTNQLLSVQYDTQTEELWILTSCANCNVSLYDSTGKLRIQKNGGKEEAILSLKSLEKGIYFVIVKDERETVYQKLIK